MTQKSPLVYYADQSKHNPEPSEKTQMPRLFDGAFNRHQKMLKHIAGIDAYPYLVEKLNAWNDLQKIKWIRHNADMKQADFLPEILFMTGKGMSPRPLNYIANFFNKTGFLSNSKVKSYNVNHFVKHYVTDSKALIDNIFNNESSYLLEFYGFDTLIANPRPPIADWHDWLDIICNYLIDNINSHGLQIPVVFNMSESARCVLYDKFERLHKYDCEVIKINLLNAQSMTQLVVEKLKNKKFNLTPPAKGLLTNLITKLYHEKRLKDFTEYQIRDFVFEDIVKRQGERIFQIPRNNLTRRKVRMITKSDIPTQIFLSTNKIVFY